MKTYRASVWYVPVGRTIEIKEAFSLHAKSAEDYMDKMRTRLEGEGASGIEFGPVGESWAVW